MRRGAAVPAGKLARTLCLLACLLATAVTAWADPVPPGNSSLPWLRPPLPQPAPAPGPEEAPAPAPPEPSGDGIVLRPAAPPNEAAEDITPGSDAPHPFRILNPAGDPDHLAQHLLVVYNSKDLDSRDLAYYYAHKRGIPEERILPLACSLNEQITRDEYDQTIRRPIVSYLFQHKWMERTSQTVRLRNQEITLLVATRNDIWAIVLMRGVPLKIASSADFTSSMQTEPQFGSNAAAVDSELALLPIFGLPLGGCVPNPLFDVANSGELRIGPELATRLILVTRLDGPTPYCVHRMIDDTLAAESRRLAGEAVIDSRGLTDVRNGYTIGDMWLRTSRDLLDADGWEVVFDDQPATLPATDPVNHVALYLGWYTATANGPWVTPPVRFVPGAIAYHLNSFSAYTVRSATRHWVGPLLENGAAATMGAVGEPYLGLTPHLDIFTRRLLDGDSFAESAYAAEPALSWMITVVGDPLYRPFQLPPEEALARAGPGRSNQRDWLLLGQVERQMFLQPAGWGVRRLEAALDRPDTGAVAHECLGDLLQKVKDPHAAEEAEREYQKALRLCVDPVDSIRIGLDLAQLQVSRKEDARAENELRSLRELYPADAPKFGVLGNSLPTGIK